MKSFCLISCFVACIFSSISFAQQTKEADFKPYNTFNIFVKDTSAVSCKLEIKFKFKRFKGILYIKKTTEKECFIVCTTQFGMKIFEFQFQEGQFRVGYCIPYLNNPEYILMFENQFRLLCGVFSPNFQVKTQSLKSLKTQTYYQTDTLFRYFFLNEANSSSFPIKMEYETHEKIMLTGQVEFSGSKQPMGMKFKQKGKGIKLFLSPIEKSTLNENDSL